MLSVVDQLSKMTGLLLMGMGLQGKGLWMVLPWADHSCLHLFPGILKQHCTPSPVPQKPSCCPLGSTVSSVLRRILQAQVNQRTQGDTVAEKAVDEGSKSYIPPVPLSSTCLTSLASVSSR